MKVLLRCLALGVLLAWGSSVAQANEKGAVYDPNAGFVGWLSMGGLPHYIDEGLAKKFYEEHIFIPRATPNPNDGFIDFINLADYGMTAWALDENDTGRQYAILLQDFAFYDYAGNRYVIPKGFIFDGASIPNTVQGWLIESGPFSDTVLVPAMIHDYMYRNPALFSRELADDLLLSNLKITGDPDPNLIYTGVRLGGWWSHNGHLWREYWEQKYGVFTMEEYYEHNLQIYYGSHSASTGDDDKARDLFSGNGQTSDGSVDGNGQGGDALPDPAETSSVVDPPDIADVIGDVVLEELGFDSFVGPELPHRRILFLFSGDLPSMKDAKQTVEGFVDLLNGDGDTLIGEGWDEAKKFLYSTKDEFENLRGVL